MRAKEAKDFLVDQIKQQAAAENVPLSELEIEMLYFTEQNGVSSKMEKLVAEFDETYDTPAYERKIAKLSKRTYRRLKREEPAAKAEWDRAIAHLQRGDHYILVMCGEHRPAHCTADCFYSP